MKWQIGFVYITIFLWPDLSWQWCRADRRAKKWNASKMVKLYFYSWLTYHIIHNLHFVDSSLKISDCTFDSWVTRVLMSKKWPSNLSYFKTLFNGTFWRKFLLCILFNYYFIEMHERIFHYDAYWPIVLKYDKWKSCQHFGLQIFKEVL